jgi:quinol monooxygenase YgiN
MVTVGLLVQVEAKPGKEETVAEFLRNAQALAEQEPDTTAWFAVRLGSSSFGIVDFFPDDDGRLTHLSGPIAQALSEQANELFSEPPRIEQLDVIAAKLPG